MRVYLKLRDFLFALLVLFRSYCFGKKFTPQNKVIIKKDTPYFSQWESSDLVEDIIKHNISAKDDPLWKSSGAQNTNDYLNWSWNGCGLACLKMVLKDTLNKSVPSVELGEKSLKYGCYRLNSEAFGKGNYFYSLDGLFYKPFVRFVKEEFNLESKIVSPMLIEDIVSNIESDHQVIASVKSGMSDSTSLLDFEGGHLVLIVGYDWDQKLIYFHNPSGLTEQTQGFAVLNFAEFRKIFAFRGIVIY